MADVADRDGKEAGLIKPLAKEFNRFRLQVLGLIPDLEEWATDVPPEYWEEHTTNLVKGVAPVLASIFMQQAETLMESLESGQDKSRKIFGVDWGVVNQRAADWARAYAGEFVKDITETTKKFVQAVVPRFYEEQMTLRELRDELSPRNSAGEDIGPFGRKRAAMIASTETTRAASEGEVAIAQEVMESGIMMKPYWETAKDDKVCPICKPLGMTESGYYNEQDRPIFPHPVTGVLYEQPPAHPNCRCSMRHEVVWPEEG